MSHDATHKNIIAVKEHSEITRSMFRDLEVKLNTLGTLIKRIDMLETQVRSLQVKLYSGGATG